MTKARVSIWSIIFAILAGVDVGFSLDAFIHKGRIGLGIFWMVLAVILTVQAIGHIRIIRYIPLEEQEGEKE